ncbi:MAG: HipA N-terminal domain-containing protein [Candidatus Omnitrophica bacterium]|nr:HipA N-terminal domain-containing protein [Candidatus Omnitrophota bacterium]
MKENNFRKAEVFFKEIPAGLLEELPNGYKFTYYERYLTKKNASAVSVTLPLRKDPYQASEMFSFFKGLLAEGWYKDIVCKTIKCDPDDDLALIRSSGDNTIGAVTVKPIKEE